MTTKYQYLTVHTYFYRKGFNKKIYGNEVQLLNPLFRGSIIELQLLYLQNSSFDTTLSNNWKLNLETNLVRIYFLAKTMFNQS